MMRYQRTSPDVLPLSNGRKPKMVCKDDDPDSGHKASTNYSHLDGKPLRGRSGSGSANHSPARDTQFNHIPLPSDSPTLPPTMTRNENLPLPPSASSSSAASPAKSGNYSDANGAIHGGGGSGDLLLQWGHNKRSRRRSRTESRAAAVAASTAPRGSDESPVNSRQTGKIQRRSAIAAAEKVAAVVAASAAMPPPCGSYGRGGSLRDSTCPAVHNSRGADERSNGVTRSEKRSPSSPPEKSQKTSAGSTPNGSMNPEAKHHHHPSDQETVGSGATAVASVGEKHLGLDHFEWPRIYLSLSRKEKEDDFLVMKGTKLPQRPKKRAKNVDKTLQYCFPGMWLSDLTRGRYEVREKKCVKKKRRGLKGMEGMDSDSE